MASTSTSVLEKEQLLRDDYVPASAVPATRSSGLKGFAESSANALSSVLSPALNPLNKAIAKLDAYREHLELPYPGQVDALGKESKSKSAISCRFTIFVLAPWQLGSACTKKAQGMADTIPAMLSRCPPQQLHVRWSKSGSQQVSQHEPGLPGHTLFHPRRKPAQSYGRTIDSRRTWHLQLCSFVCNEQGAQAYSL